MVCLQRNRGVEGEKWAALVFSSVEIRFNWWRVREVTPVEGEKEAAPVEAEDSTPLGEECGVQDPCTVVLRAYIDRKSTLCGIDIDFNAPPMSKNLNLGSRLQIHSVVIETDADGDDVYDNNGFSNHEVEEYSDLDLDEVLDDINNEGTNDDGNVNVSSIGNPNRGIMICNDLGAHMLIIDLMRRMRLNSQNTPIYYLLTGWQQILDMRSCSWAKNLLPKKSVYFPLSSIA
ncbi:hypothetical protein GOBAR_DD21137 [Gossypium barbadense]|nr:hypothetical protein GOBAR_DD21137 [Gossypium barbadense]